jgi:metal-responsive CopG/Arc/MetJ family transcriptional regulator
MKGKTSVTLSQSLLAEIDRHAGRRVNRSQFIETAVRGYIAALVCRKQNLRDLAIINRRAPASTGKRETCLTIKESNNSKKGETWKTA